MSKDLLIKLVKLANNNPNEHEANLAARRAVKMIAENNFEIIGGDPSVKKKTTIPPRQSPPGHTYADVKRSENSWWGSYRPSSSGSTFDVPDDLWELLRN